MLNRNKMLFNLLVVVGLLLAACAPATPVSVPQTVVVTETPQPMLTLTPTNTPTPRATSTPSISPTSTTMKVLVTVTPSATPGVCQPKYMPEDVTIPDGTELGAGEAFTKTWRIEDVACRWSGYSLDYLGGTLATDVTSVKVPNATAGKAVDVTVKQLSPKWPGSYVSFWALKDNDGKTFGILTIVIKVKGADVVRGPAGCVLNDAYVADMNFLDGDRVFPGERFTKTWRIINNGNCQHGTDYEVAFVAGNITSTGSKVPQIPAGSKGDVEANFVAPKELGWYYVLLEVRAPNGAVTGTLTMIVRVEQNN